jgi:hypothetical protein
MVEILELEVMTTITRKLEQRRVYIKGSGSDARKGMG